MHAPACSLLVAAALAGACGPADPAGIPPGLDTTLHLLQLNRLQGFAEGIPCLPAGERPLAATADLRDRLRQQGDHALLACMGDTLVPTDLEYRHRSTRRSAAARGWVLLEAMGAAGVDLFVPGLTDLQMGAAELVRRAREAGVPLVLTNVTIEGEQLPTHLVIDAGGLRLACLGVLPARSSIQKGTRKVVAQVSIPGVRVENPSQTVGRVARQILDDGAADLVAVFSAGTSGINNRLLDLPSVDFVLGANDPAAKVVPAIFRAGSAYLLAAHKGRQVGHTTLTIVGGDMTLQDRSPRHTLKTTVARDQAWLDQYIAWYGTDDIDLLAREAGGEYEREFRDRARLIGANREHLAMLEAYTGSALDHQLARLEPTAADHPVAAALARQGPAILEGLAAADLEPLTPFERPGNRPYVPGPEACASCHQRQHRFWEGTGHARAYETLKATQRHQDVACLRCHSTGYGHADGYRDPRREAPLGGVSCFACHQVTSTHAEDPRLVVYPVYVRRALDGMQCVSCHHPLRSPGFRRVDDIGPVSCPPMRPDDPALTAARRRALDEIAARRAEGADDRIDRFLEARALIGLGRARGYELLRAFAVDNTDDPAQALSIAFTLDRGKRSSDAQAVLRDYLDHQHGDPDVNREYVRMLLEASDRTARDAAAALRHLQLVLPPEITPEDLWLDFRVLHVDALFALDTPEHLQQGRDLLQTLLRLAGDDPRVVDRVQRYTPR